MAEDLSDIVVLKQAAQILQCCVKSVYNFRDRGQLACWRRGDRVWVTSRTAIRQFLTRRMHPAYQATETAPNHDWDRLRERYA